MMNSSRDWGFKFYDTVAAVGVGLPSETSSQLRTCVSGQGHAVPKLSGALSTGTLVAPTRATRNYRD